MLETADVKCHGVQLYNNKGCSQYLMSYEALLEKRELVASYWVCGATVYVQI